LSLTVDAIGPFILTGGLLYQQGARRPRRLEKSIANFFFIILTFFVNSLFTLFTNTYMIPLMSLVHIQVKLLHLLHSLRNFVLMDCVLHSTLPYNNRTLHVSGSISVHHQDSSTVHTAISICHTVYADCLLARSQQHLYVLLCVQS